MTESKLLSEGPGGEMIPFRFANAVEQQSYPTYERLMITTGASLVDLLLKLASEHPGPFRLLLIMVEGVGVEEGRYGLQDELELWQLNDWLESHRRFLEVDGRHHFWINSVDNQLLLVLDQHGYIYAYGPVLRWKAELTARGYGPTVASVPVPHGHRYLRELDGELADLLEEYAWHHSPLHEGDRS